MKYKPGIVGEGSGKMGSMVFSRNSYGPYIKQWSAGTNPNTLRQQEVRTNWQALSGAWKNELTEANRESWRLYAANVTVKDVFGVDIHLSGYSMFMRTNTVALGGSVDQINAGPTNFTLGPVDSSLSAVASEGSQDLVFTFDANMDWVDEDGALLQIQVSRPVNDSRIYIPPVYRLAGFLLGNSTTPETSPGTLSVPFQVAETQKIQVAGRILMADGRLSSHFLSTSSVVA